MHQSPEVRKSRELISEIWFRSLKLDIFAGNERNSLSFTIHHIHNGTVNYVLCAVCSSHICMIAYAMFVNYSVILGVDEGIKLKKQWKTKTKKKTTIMILNKAGGNTRRQKTTIIIVKGTRVAVCSMQAQVVNAKLLDIVKWCRVTEAKRTMTFHR